MGKQTGSGGHNKVNYRLTVSCMEWFMVREIPEIFDEIEKPQIEVSNDELILALAQRNVDMNKRVLQLEANQG